MRGADDVPGALERYRDRLTRARRLYVGYSGGLDSTVLLHALRTHVPRPVIALHAHHGLHADADEWQAHCAAFCVAQGVELQTRRLDVVEAGGGPEAAAREARHAWFVETLGEGDLLLLAHHEDDQAETLMLRLLRGAGPDGLAAIPRERSCGEGVLLRPFLDLPRSTLTAYADSRTLARLDDPSNRDERFDRNYLRLRVLPLLEARWPGCRRTLARAARLLRDQGTATGELTPPRTIASITGDPGLALAELAGGPATTALLLRAWLREQGLPMPPEARLREFLRQLREGDGASLAWDTRRLTRFRDAVFLHPAPVPAPVFECPIAVGERVQVDGMGSVTLCAAEAARGDASAETQHGGAPGTFLLRSRGGGERMRTDAGSRALKKLLQERRVPPWWRDRLPLLFELRAGGMELIAAGPFIAAPRLAKLKLELRWEP